MQNLNFKIIYYLAIILSICFQTISASPLEILPNEREIVGYFLDSNLREASGIATSAYEKNQLFHVNDSGDSARLLVTDFKGKFIQSINIRNHVANDIEDMSSGKCFSGKNCLFIGDIGDNRSERKQIQLIIVEETKQLPKEISAEKILTLQYEDGPRDAEGMALGPNQHLYILSKENKLAERLAFPSRLYILRSENWFNSSSYPSDKAPKILEYRGEIDLKRFSQETLMFANVATSIDIDIARKKMLILTYTAAYMISLNLNAAGEIDWREDKAPQNKDIVKIPLKRLFQQEAVTFLPLNTSKIPTNENIEVWSFLYTSEAPPGPIPPELVRVELKEIYGK
ncbi:MAG: hypothetical protein KBD78_12635 [Oligoflexales bacterium]|nr:hypothetical protein [Oligoflexales bacterium]